MRCLFDIAKVAKNLRLGRPWALGKTKYYFSNKAVVLGLWVSTPIGLNDLYTEVTEDYEKTDIYLYHNSQQ